MRKFERLPAAELLSTVANLKTPELSKAMRNASSTFGPLIGNLDFIRTLDGYTNQERSCIQQIRLTLEIKIATFGEKFVEKCFAPELAEIQERAGIEYSIRDINDPQKTSDNTLESIIRTREKRLTQEDEELQKRLPALKQKFISRLIKATEGNRPNQRRYNEKEIQEFITILDGYEYVLTDPLAGRNGAAFYSIPIVLLSSTTELPLEDVFAHEARHITAGIGGVRHVNVDYIELVKTGLAFGFGDNKTYKWLNEAFTEIDTALLYDREAVAYKKYIELFSVLFVSPTTTIGYDLFRRAYDENIDPMNKATETLALFTAIRRIYGTRFLPNISSVILHIEAYAQDAGAKSDDVFNSLLTQLISIVASKAGRSYIENAQTDDFKDPESFLQGFASNERRNN